MRHARRQHRGFTLLEILTAIVLLAVVLPVVMQGISLGLMASSQARRSAEAITLAQNKLAELATATQIPPGGQSGDFAPDHPEYHWQANTVTQNLNMIEIDVTVSWTGRSGDRKVSLSTLVYKPS